MVLDFQVTDLPFPVFHSWDFSQVPGAWKLLQLLHILTQSLRCIRDTSEGLVYLHTNRLMFMVHVGKYTVRPMGSVMGIKLWMHTNAKWYNMYIYNIYIYTNYIYIYVACLPWYTRATWLFLKHRHIRDVHTNGCLRMQCQVKIRCHHFVTTQCDRIKYSIEMSILLTHWSMAIMLK